MNELIKIEEREGKQIVSARELYIGLGLDKSNWSRWSVQNIIEDKFFAENEDWVGFVTMTNGNEIKDYAITVEFAKHIAMMARTEKSHAYRNYFICCEKKIQTYIPKTYSEALMLAAKQAEQIEQQQKQIEVQQPKAEYYDALIDRNGLTNFRDTAKLIGIGEKAFIFYLIDHKYIYRDPKGKLYPIAEYTGRYFEIKEWIHGEKTGVQTLITALGREKFMKNIKNVLNTND